MYWRGDWIESKTQHKIYWWGSSQMSTWQASYPCFFFHVRGVLVTLLYGNTGSTDTPGVNEMRPEVARTEEQQNSLSVLLFWLVLACLLKPLPLVTHHTPPSPFYFISIDQPSIPITLQPFISPSFGITTVSLYSTCCFVRAEEMIMISLQFVLQMCQGFDLFTPLWLCCSIATAPHYQQSKPNLCIKHTHKDSQTSAHWFFFLFTERWINRLCGCW